MIGNCWTAGTIDCFRHIKWTRRPAAFSYSDTLFFFYVHHPCRHDWGIVLIISAILEFSLVSFLSYLVNFNLLYLVKLKSWHFSLIFGLWSMTTIIFFFYVKVFLSHADNQPPHKGPQNFGWGMGLGRDPYLFSHISYFCCWFQLLLIS